MPKSPSLSPPRYVKHKASGQAVVYHGGRTIYLGKYGSAASRKVYKRLVAEWTTKSGPLTTSEEITVSEVMLAYLSHAKSYYRKDGKATREFGHIVEVCRLIKPLYGHDSTVEFGPLALKTIRQLLIDADISRKHINKQVDRIKRIFRWAAAEELIPARVPQALGMVAGLRKGRSEARETPPVRSVDDAIIEATLEHLPEIVADMVRLQRLCGCRPTEVCSIRPCDIDRSGEVWLYRPATHKTEHQERGRIVPLGPKSQEILNRYMARNAQTYCFRPCDSEAKRRAVARAKRKTPLSCGNITGSNRKQKPKRRPGERYTKDSYSQAVRRTCDKAGIERWSPSRLRHSAATEIRRGFGLEAAQIILGHSEANVTQIYAERDMAKGLEVAKRIG